MCIKASSAIIASLVLIQAAAQIEYFSAANMDLQEEGAVSLLQVSTEVSKHIFSGGSADSQLPAGLAQALFEVGSEQAWWTPYKGSHFPHWVQYWWPLTICVVIVCCVIYIGTILYGKATDSGCEDQIDEPLEMCNQMPGSRDRYDAFALSDFHREKLMKAAPRVAFAFVCWSIGLYFNNLCQAWLQNNMHAYYEHKWHVGGGSVILWDLGHNIFGGIEIKPWVADTWCSITPFLAFVRFLFLPGPYSMRWSILRRLLLIWGFLWAFRGAMIVSTVMPNPEKTCKPKISFPDNIFLEAWANMPFVFWRSELTCHDVIFSGHTVALTLATLSFLHYSERAPWPQFQSWPTWLSVPGPFIFKALHMANMLAGFFIIIVSKTHYTADVLIGFGVAVLAFQAYHAAIGVAFMPESKLTFLSSAICPVLPVIRWFEEDAAEVACFKRTVFETAAY